MADPTPRAHIWPYGLVIVASVVAVLWTLAAERDRARLRVERADQALEAARQIRVAQRAYRERRGEYGWLGELAEAGLLPGFTVVADEQGPHVVAGGYRVEVLLPLRGSQAGDQMLVVPQGGGVIDRALRTRHFAVVARPGGPAPRGYRTFYLDDGEGTWISEGVSDEEGYARNPLPQLLLSRSAGDDLTGLNWHRLEGLRSDAP